jgi:hypothetical protein
LKKKVFQCATELLLLLLFKVCIQGARRLNKNYRNKTHLPKFWSRMLQIEWVEEWFEETYLKYMKSMERIEGKKIKREKKEYYGQYSNNPIGQNV